METIRVNMTPCEDVKTIHASQNDNEARQWGFELHNNGEKIDSSSISDQLVFKAYEGGTEEILPTNGSTPTTSPFKGDIRYPQGILSDQEFLYRESPTEEDGLAKITDIKGNTSVWNQNCYSFSALRSTLSSSINSQTDITCTASSGQTSFGIIIQDDTGYFNFIGGHTYLLSMNISEITVNNFSRISPESALNPQTLARETGRYTVICNPTASGTRSILCYLSGTTTTSDIFKFNSVQIVDLTMLNDSRITDYDSFRTYYPLSFYPYNSGSLLSFNGNGIKTVGKNLVFKTIPNSSINGSGVIISTSNFQMSVAQVLKGKEYVITTNDNSKKVLGFFYDEPVVGSASYNGERIDDSSSYTFTSPITGYVAFRSLGGYSTPMLEFGSTSTDYEPYTSSTLSLPISTYFSNGMKSAGSVYDELTETKAITRIGSVDLGSLTWNYRTDGTALAPYFWASFTGIKSQGNPTQFKANIICSKYNSVRRTVNEFVDGTICVDGTNTTLTQIQIKDPSYTDATAFKNSLQGQYLYYELATKSETSFTTASLVTENTEIPLSNEDGVLIGKCTEQLSSESGFFDAKIKLADEDGECYSNKIQLHIERRPS